jgi:hypothetical protein
MRIDGITPLLQSMLADTRTRDGFALPAAIASAAAATAEAPPSTPPPVVPTSATSVQMMVALAAVDPVSERRRKIAVEADRGLTLLERLRDDLAHGAAPPERVQELATWVEAFVVPDDAAVTPEFAKVARDLEVRVRVELAKLDLNA